jgi:signal recognition particle receptor subunit beta
MSAVSRELVRLFASPSTPKMSESSTHCAVTDIPLLLLANKQDIPGALSVDDVTEALDVGDLPCRTKKVLGCSATDLSSLHVAMNSMMSMWAASDATTRAGPNARSSKGASTPTSIQLSGTAGL